MTIISLNITASDQDPDTLYMTVGTFEPLRDKVFLGGWTQGESAHAGVMLIERRYIPPSEDGRGSGGYVYKGVADLGKPDLRAVTIREHRVREGFYIQLAVTSLNVYYPRAPLSEDMLEDPTVLSLFAQAARHSLMTPSHMVDWARYANLPNTPETVRTAILSPDSVR